MQVNDYKYITQDHPPGGHEPTKPPTEPPTEPDEEKEDEAEKK